jgi:hypothetical protein
MPDNADCRAFLGELLGEQHGRPGGMGGKGQPALAGHGLFRRVPS